MNKNLCNLRKVIFALIGMSTLVSSLDAQFIYKGGDLTLGFRKTGSSQGLYEAVVDLGAATNYVYLTPGTTVNITKYTNNTQLVPNTFNNLTNLSWSVCGYAPSATLFPNYAVDTLWITVPRVGGVQAAAANRAAISDQQQSAGPIKTIGNGAQILSGQTSGGVNNTVTFLQEAYSTAQSLDYYTEVSDPTTSSIGDLQAYAPNDVNANIINIENTTPTPFTTAVQSDLYQLVPTGHTDPNNGLSSGPGYYVGYFQLNTDGTMTFTRATTTVAAPVAGFTASPTSGTVPLPVVFTDASTGSITNWIWNFGDGSSVTNSSNVSANHTYTTAGTYSPSLTAAGPGGANTLSRTSYIVVSAVTSSTPTFNGVTLSGGKLVISGTNGTATTQYRVLSSTNLASGTWTPVYTNQFSGTGTFSYTNSSPTGPRTFYRLVAP
jgi:PKD repeat protein